MNRISARVLKKENVPINKLERVMHKNVRPFAPVCRKPKHMVSGQVFY